jgi:hypothetical protein
MLDDLQLVRLAREIAMDIRELDEILSDHNVSRAAFERLQRNQNFSRMLANELSAWQSAANTNERVRFKTAAMVEDFLPELYKQLINEREPLLAKTKALEFIAKLAGYNQIDRADQVSPGDRVVVQINLGSDQQLSFEKRLPYKVIDVAPAAPSISEDDIQKSFDESLDAADNPV